MDEFTKLVTIATWLVTYPTEPPTSPPPTDPSVVFVEPPPGSDAAELAIAVISPTEYREIIALRETAPGEYYQRMTHIRCQNVHEARTNELHRLATMINRVNDDCQPYVALLGADRYPVKPVIYNKTTFIDYLMKLQRWLAWAKKRVAG